MAFFPVPKHRILAEKVPAHSLPFWNLLVMMKPHSLELHSVKNRFRGGRFDNAGQRSLRMIFFGNRPSLAVQFVFHNSDPLSDQSWFDPGTMTS